MVQTAMLRAAHQLLDQPLIFVDPIAVGLVSEASEQAIFDAAAEFRSPSMTMRRASMVLRSRFAEDRLAAAANRGVRQYVIAAAGLDTFPWRQPPFAREMRIFAADLPVTLAWVIQRFRERGLSQPHNLTFVPVDLEDGQLGQQLSKFGFAVDEPMFCSALGIVQYLTQGAVDSLLRFAASAQRGSEIAFSFTPPDDVLEESARTELRRTLVRCENFGEPWLTRLDPQTAIARLESMGLTDVVHFTPELAQERYISTRQDGLTASRTTHCIAALV